MEQPPNYVRSPRMPLHRRHTVSSGRPAPKKPVSAPRVPFLPTSDHKLSQLFEDMVWQVEQGVHRIEVLERELRLERATRETARDDADERVERAKRSSAAAVAATHSFLDSEREMFEADRAVLEDCVRANLAAFAALAAEVPPLLESRSSQSPAPLLPVPVPVVDRGSQSWKVMADRASSPPPPPGSPPGTPLSVKRLRAAARGAHDLVARASSTRVDAQLDELRRGLRVVKHGRSGNPRAVWLFLDAADRLCWARATSQDPPALSKLNVKRRLGLRPDLDLDVVRGKQTMPLLRPSAKKAPHFACLSVVLAAHDVGDDGRSSLDFELASVERRDALADALEAAVDRAAQRVLDETPSSSPKWADDARVRAVLRRARLRRLPVEGD